MSSSISRRAVGLAATTLVLCVAAPHGAAFAATPGGRDAYDVLRARAGMITQPTQPTPAGADASASLRAPVPSGLLKFVELKRGLFRFAGASGIGHPGGANVGIGTRPDRDENEPTVTSDPRNGRILVAGSHSFDPVTQINRCVAYTSRDGGARWSRGVALPQLTPESTCSDPVLAFAPDGRAVYFAYMDIKGSETIVGDPEDPELVTFESQLDVLVSRSTDSGRTWSAPVIALQADRSRVSFVPQTGEITEFEPGFDYDKPWIGTHVPVDGRKAGDGDRVYVTATRFDTFHPGMACAIAFTASRNRAASWSTPAELDSSGGDCGTPVLVQGSRPSGGLGDDVLVAWYHSGADGPFQGAFEIRTASSRDGGRRFEAPVTAATDSFEVPFFLGPYAFYHRWGATMFPDVEVAHDGRAHIVYTHDPAENGVTIADPVTGEEVFVPDVSTTAEDGDIRYLRSASRGYGPDAWSAPVTLNDDRLVRAQGFPALETAPRGRRHTEVRVLWEDHRRSPEVAVTDPLDPAQFEQSSNRFYDVFATSGDGGGGWSRNRRVTDRSSISDFIFNGDYFDLTASFFGVWTDRRHQTSTGAALDAQGNVVIDEPALEDNVFGASLAADGRYDDGHGG